MGLLRKIGDWYYEKFKKHTLDERVKRQALRVQIEKNAPIPIRLKAVSGEYGLILTLGNIRRMKESGSLSIDWQDCRYTGLPIIRHKGISWEIVVIGENPESMNDNLQYRLFEFIERRYADPS